MKYRAEIDGLRALAVVPVILFHAGFEWFSGGFVGVDVFFVISGYLIATIIISEMAEGKFSIVNFYERRARRILPALFFVMAACLPFAWLWLTPNYLKDFGQSLVAVSTFSSNILFWIESGYFDTAADLKPLLHTWSLAVEEQFYMLFPIFLMLTWRLGVKSILILLSIVFIVSLGLAQWGAYFKPSATFFLLPTRGWELLVGVFAAFYLKYKPHPKSASINQVLSLLGFSIIFYSAVTFDENTPFPSLYALIPTIGTGLVIVSAVPKTFVHSLLSFKPIVGIGLISYSAYLWHQPLLAFGRHRKLLEASDLETLSLCFISFLLAWISFKFIESPFRDRKKITTSNFLKSALVGVFIFISFGLSVHFNDGFKDRLNYYLDTVTLIESPLREECHTKEIACEFFGGPSEYATFGDSHVVEISYALAEYLQPLGVSVQQNSYSSCTPNYSDTNSYCFEWTKQAIERITNSASIKNVIVSYRLEHYLKNSENPSQIWDDLFKILNEFLISGKKVYFIIQPPELPASIYKMILIGDSDRLEGLTRKQHNHNNDYVQNRINEIPSEVILVDPSNWFCDDQFCYANDLGGYFYTDNNHLSLYGASLIVKKGLFNDNGL